jgi:thermitase
MNRKNFWTHLGIALVVIAMAAILGQIRFWENNRNEVVIEKTTKLKPIAVKRTVKDSQPEVLVKFRPGVSFDEIKKLTAKNNDRVEDEIESVKGLTTIDDLDNADAKTVAEQYAKMTDLVVYAEPNFEINLNDPAENYTPRNLLDRKTDDETTSPNDPMFSDQWALNNTGQSGGKAESDLRAVKAWLKTKGSSDVVVAVLDTGVDYTHPDLITNIWFRPDNVPQYTDDELGTFDDYHGFNAADNNGDPMDDNGHGTHCAGIIGAEGDNDIGIAGINWKVEIMPLKFLGRSGNGSTKDAIEAINYAIDRKKNGVNLRVISASWGSTMKSKALGDVIRAAGEEGILFVAAAGNSSTNNDNRPHYPSNYDLPNVISVAASDHNDELASFSNFGIKTVHIAAPGKDILSTWLNDNFREASGTSMATPYVSGIAALVLASDSSLTVEQLRAKLLKSVDKIDSMSDKIESGGRINAEKALE